MFLKSLFGNKSVERPPMLDFERVFGFKPTPLSTRNGVPVYSQQQIDAVGYVLSERAREFLQACKEQTTLLRQELPTVSLDGLGKQLAGHVKEVTKAAFSVSETKGRFWFAHRKAAEQRFPVKETVHEYADPWWEQFILAHQAKVEGEEPTF